MILTILSVVAACYPLSASASDMSEQFSERYESLIPPPNSSVHSDYLLQQIALGSDYNVRMLDKIYIQNSMINEKYDALIERCDTIIRQNDKIIEWLKKIAQQPQL